MLSRYEPWNLINLLHQDIDGRGDVKPSPASNKDSRVNKWMPAVDIVEQKDCYVLRADLPGVQPENIDVNLENGVLSLSGNRDPASADEVEGVRRIERVSGKFFRRFNLPESTAVEDISATCTNGILEIVIPKQPAIQARKITVEAA
jgi:HSP20 family protein